MTPQRAKPGIGEKRNLLRTATALTLAVAVLAVIAAAGGLLVSGLYRDPSAVVSAIRGQDLLTLLVLPVLVAAVRLARRGSIRAAILWIGLLGYLAYTYTGAAFGYYLNRFVLVYIALFSLCAFALVSVCLGLDGARVEQEFRKGFPRRAAAAFLLVIAVMLVVPEVAQLIPFLTEGTLPELITRAGAVNSFVYVLDLGVIAPLCVLAAVGLLRRRPWAIVLSGCMLIKAATMGLALISMDAFSWWAGGRIELAYTAMYSVIAAGGLGLSIALLSSGRKDAKRSIRDTR